MGSARAAFEFVPVSPYLQEEDDGEPMGDVDLFALTQNDALTVNSKWLQHLEERLLGEDGHPRKSREVEDPHRSVTIELPGDQLSCLVAVCSMSAVCKQPLLIQSMKCSSSLFIWWLQTAFLRVHLVVVQNGPCAGVGVWQHSVDSGKVS